MVKMLAFLDKLTLLELHVFQVAGDSRVNFDFIDRLDPPDKVFSFGDRLVLGLDCADRNRSRCLLLRGRRNDRDTNYKTNADRSAHRAFGDASGSGPLFGRPDRQQPSSPYTRKYTRKGWCRNW